MTQDITEVSFVDFLKHCGKNKPIIKGNWLITCDLPRDYYRNNSPWRTVTELVFTGSVKFSDDVKNMCNFGDIFPNIETADLSTWDISNIQNLDKTFSGCRMLKELNVSTWEAKSCINACRMFESCWSLKRLNIPKLITKTTCSASTMFANCESLVSLILTNWDTSGLTKLEDRKSVV